MKSGNIVSYQQQNIKRQQLHIKHFASWTKKQKNSPKSLELKKKKIARKRQNVKENIYQHYYKCKIFIVVAVIVVHYVCNLSAGVFVCMFYMKKIKVYRDEMVRRQKNKKNKKKQQISVCIAWFLFCLYFSFRLYIFQKGIKRLRLRFAMNKV